MKEQGNTGTAAAKPSHDQKPASGVNLTKVEQQADGIKEIVAQAAGDIRSNVSDQVLDLTSKATERVQDLSAKASKLVGSGMANAQQVYEKGRTVALDTRDQAVQKITSDPLKSMLITFGVGVGVGSVVGLLAARGARSRAMSASR